MQLFDGKLLAATIQQEIADAISSSTQRAPGLAVLLVGDNPASQIYVRRKRKACEETGIHSIFKHFPSHTSEAEILLEIDRLNRDPSVDGILVQLPLPSHINAQKICCRVDPLKDVDGFHPNNLGKLLNGETDGFIPCTPLGIKTILERYNIPTNGKHVVIMGRSNIVGKPMAALMMQNAPGANATVTVVHSHSTNLPVITRSADILIAAIGCPKTVTADMIKEGAVVIDVGINKIESAKKAGYEIVGDVDFASVKHKCSFITPVPGGVGPLTIAMLLQNTLSSYQKRIK